VLLVEANKSSVGEAKKQCLLIMKDMANTNGQEVVFSFVTIGEQWQIVVYNNNTFTETSNC